MFKQTSKSKGYAWFKFMAAAIAATAQPVHTNPLRHSVVVVNTLAPDS